MFFLWLEISNIFTKNYGKEVYNLVQSTGAQEERIGTVGEIFSIKKTKGFNFKLHGSSKQSLGSVEGSENTLHAEALVGQGCSVRESRLGSVLWLLN